MIKFTRKQLVIFNIFFFPIVVFFCLLSLFNISSVDVFFRSCIILPISFIFGYILFFLVRKKIYDIQLLIIFLFFIKMFFLPVIIITCGKFDISNYNSNLRNNIYNAVFIQTLEWLSVILSLCSMKLEFNDVIQFDKDSDIHENKLLVKVSQLCIFFTLVGIILFPSLLYKYHPNYIVAEEQEILWKQYSSIALSTINKYVYYPLNWLLTITRVLVVYLLVIYIWKRFATKNSIFSIIISFTLILFFLVLFVPDDVAASIIFAFSTFILITKLYPRYARKIVVIILVCAFVFFSMNFFLKPFLNSFDFHESLSALSRRINAYFSGVINVSGALEMYPLHNKAEYFFGDFLRSFPVLKGFFVTLPTSTELFNHALGYDPIYNSQIIPSEGQSFFYFSYFGVIIIPFIIIRLCSILYNRMLQARSTYDFWMYSFFVLLLGFGIVMYDSFLILNLFLTYVPLLFLSFFERKR